MFRGILARKPVASIQNDLVANPITTAAWAELSASLEQGACAVEIYNPSGSTIELSTGAVGEEDDHIMPYTVLPGGSSILLPYEFARGARLSAKAVDQNANTNIFIMNFLG